MDTMTETSKKVRLHAKQTYEELKAMLHKLTEIREHDDTLLKAIPIITKLEGATLEAMATFYTLAVNAGMFYGPPVYHTEK